MSRGDGDGADAAAAACAEALAPLAGAAPRGLLVFESALRAATAPDEAIARCAAGAPFARGATAGQIARMRGLAGFHNQAFAALAIA